MAYSPQDKDVAIEENEFILLFNTTTGDVKINYLTIDPYSRKKLLPKVNHITWPKLKHIVGYGLVVYDNCLYIIGGQDLESKKYLTQMLKFDPVSNKWSNCCPLKKGRSKFAVCVVDRRIFAIGGEISEDGTTTDICEAYEPMVDMWNMEGKIIVPRKLHACVVWNERVYLTGGTQDKKAIYCDDFWQMRKHFPKPLSSEYKYKWFHMGPSVKHPLTLPRKLRYHSMTLCGDTAYVLGGVAEGDSYDGINLYDDTEAVNGDSISCHGDKDHETAIKPETNDKAKTQSANLEESQTTQTYYDIMQRKSSKKVTTDMPKTIVATSQFLESCYLKDTIPNLPPPELKTKDKAKKKENSENNLQKVQEIHNPKFRRCAKPRKPRCGAGTVVLDQRIYVIGGHQHEHPEEHVDMIEYYHTQKKKWRKVFPLGEGDFQNVTCCVLKVPTSNSDFKNSFPYNWPLW